VSLLKHLDYGPPLLKTLTQNKMQSSLVYMTLHSGSF
jgi:hypothetical protein